MSRNPRRGILLMVAAMAVFSLQDGLSRHLAESYNTLMVVMVRYWAFAGFVVLLALRRPEGFRAAIASRRRGIHLIRGLLLVAEVCLIIWGYTMIGLIESHAIFALCPLLVVALSGPVLGERVGWTRWVAVLAGLAGVMVILRPGSGVLSPVALLPLMSALLYAVFIILTRLTARDEPTFPALFWPAVTGAAFMTVIGLPAWQTVQGADLVWLAAYSGLAVLANWLVLKCYEAAEASVVQPYAYSQFVFVSLVGFVVFAERPEPAVFLGGAIIIAAGLFALMATRSEGKRTATP